MNFFAEAAAARDRLESDLSLIARIPVEEVQRLASDIAIVCKWTRHLEDDTNENSLGEQQAAKAIAAVIDAHNALTEWWNTDDPVGMELWRYASASTPLDMLNAYMRLLSQRELIPTEDGFPDADAAGITR